LYSGVDGDLFDSVTSREIGMEEYEVKIIFDQIAHAIAVSFQGYNIVVVLKFCRIVSS
jgi:hypothetical protein